MKQLTYLDLISQAVSVGILVTLFIVYTPIIENQNLALFAGALLAANVVRVGVFWNFRRIANLRGSRVVRPISNKVSDTIANTVAVIWFAFIAALSALFGSAMHWSLNFQFIMAVSIILTIVFGQLICRWIPTKSWLPYVISSLISFGAALLLGAVSTG